MNPTTARPLFRLVALLVVCLLPSIAAAQIPQFDAFYVFGDSLADNGNIFIQTTAMGMQPPVPPSVTPHRTYFNGRFSNGYIAFEYLWQRLSGHKPGSPHGLKPSLPRHSSRNLARSTSRSGEQERDTSTNARGILIAWTERSG